MVQGLWFRGFKDYGFELVVGGWGLRVQGLGFRKGFKWRDKKGRDGEGEGERERG